MSSRDTRREFEQIVARLTGEEPAPIKRTRKPLKRATLAILAVAAGLLWAGLSVLMVMWGAVGVVVTCLVVAAVAVSAAVLVRRG